MDAMFNYFLENPYILAIIAAVIFVLALLAIFKRLFTFITTIFLLAVALLAGYAALYPKESVHRVQELLTREEIKGTVEKLQQNVEEYKERITQ